MTREEAIKYGQDQLDIFGGLHKEFIMIALDALRQEPVTVETIDQYCKEHNYFLCEKGTEKIILDDIKAEIETEKESMIQHNGTSDLGLALEIIDKHIGKE